MFIGALTLSPISDVYGRRPVHIFGLVVSFLTGIWIYFYPSWTSILISLFIKGIAMYSRISITYLYILELYDEQKCKVVAMIVMCINNSLGGLMAIYLIAGGRNAKFFLLSTLFILLYSLIFVPFVPESPKLMHSLK